MGMWKKKKSTGGGLNSLQSEKCVRAVANYHLRFSSELAGHGAGLQRAVIFHLQQCFPSITPRLATICGRERLVATETRAIYLASGWMGAQ